MHHLLLRQLMSLQLDEVNPPSSPEAWAAFLAKTNQTYRDAEKDRYLLERSIEISSREMQERWHDLQLMEQRWRSLVQCTPGLIITVDRDAKVLFVNRPDEIEISGGIMGKSLLEILSDNDRIRTEIALERVFSQKGSDGFEARLNSEAKNPIWFSIRTGPVLADGEVVAAVIVATDVSEHKHLEALINEDRARSAFSGKMATLGEMAGGVAHEINNPLAIIVNHASLLQEILAETKPDLSLAITMASKIESTVGRITKIVKSMRSFARDGAQDAPCRASLHDILAETLGLCQERFRSAGITLNTPPYDKNIAAECRASEISQVLLNLLNNSYDAVAGLEEKWINVTIRDLGEKIEIAITDSGRGIPEAIREKVLQPFFTTKPVGKGTGLGLSISRAIIQNHRGDLIYDTESPNTRFFFKLPKCI